MYRCSVALHFKATAVWGSYLIQGPVSTFIVYCSDNTEGEECSNETGCQQLTYEAVRVIFVHL